MSRLWIKKSLVAAVATLVGCSSGADGFPSPDGMGGDGSDASGGTGGSSGGSDSSDNQTACTPGRSVACPCGPVDGSQTCREDGSGFSECVCPDAETGGSGSGGDSGSSGGSQETGGDTSSGGANVGSGGATGGTVSTGGASGGDWSGGANSGGSSSGGAPDGGSSSGGSCTEEYFADSDQDGFGDPEAGSCTFVPGYVTNSDDCYDGNAEAKPQELEPALSTDHWEEDRGDGSWDYDCDGEETVYWEQMQDCGANAGWADGTVPECGVEAFWGTRNCSGGVQQIQRCR